mgnify:CR=1 FL=1|jgi:hypothetical protein
MQNKIRLLVTARDPASANDIAQLLPHLFNHERFVVRIIAQEPAYSILLSRNADSDTFVLDFIDSIENTSHEYIENVLKEVFLIFQPDSLLTGISGPDYGVDEISLGICFTHNGVKSFSIQSYWGDLNISCGVYADTIFVLDEFASKVTAQRNADCKTVVTGPLQSNHYDNIDIKTERAAFRTEYGVEVDTPIIALFGQPLFECEWYRTTLDLFIKSVSKSIPHVRIIYKPHPKETSESIDWVSKKLNESGIEYSVKGDINTLILLTGTDVAVSLFSTIGYDLQNLLSRSNIAFSVPMYLFFNENCVKWFEEYCKFQKIPMTENGMSIVVESAGELESKLQTAITVEAKRKCHKSVLSHFPCSTDATSVVIETLLVSP